MKILYVGYYCEPSEWGALARCNILALEKAGLDVVIRPIRFNPSLPCPQALQHLQDKDESDCTVLIQHVFPEHLVGTDKFDRNIAILSNVAWSISHSPWQEHLSLVDEVWVGSMAGLLGTEALSVPTKIVPQAIDTSIFEGTPPEINIPTTDGKCIFYTMVGPNDREGLAQVIRTFHSEFDRSDLAVLVIVMTDPSQEEATQTKFVEELSTRIKGALKLETSPELHAQDVVVVVPPLAPELLSVHKYCTKYISCNQALNSPVQELFALGFGSAPIVTDRGVSSGFVFVEDAIPSVTRTKLSPRGQAFDDTDNGNNYELIMDDEKLKRRMRWTYEGWKENPIQYNLSNQKSGLRAIDTFSLKTVGETMKEAINGSL
jgi:hypothetical protein